MLSFSTGQKCTDFHNNAKKISMNAIFKNKLVVLYFMVDIVK